MDDNEKPPISGKVATDVAIEAANRGPIRVDQVATDIPVPADDPQIVAGPRKAPPRLPQAIAPQRPLPGAHG